MIKVARAIVVVAVVLLMLSACSEPPERSSGPHSPPSRRPSNETASPAATEPGEVAGIELPKPRPLPPSEWVTGSDKSDNVFVALHSMPRPAVLDDALAALDEASAAAAFFVPGKWIESHAEEAAGVVEADHIMGNRGWDATALTGRRREHVRRSLLKTERAAAAIGANPRPFLAPPMTKRDERMLTVAGRLGYRAVSWSVAPPRGRAEDVTAAILESVRPGAIVAIDLRLKSHVVALPDVLSGLSRKGYSVASWRDLRTARAVRWDRPLSIGAEGPLVERIQKALNGATYPAGDPDGTFGTVTQHALNAFERVESVDLGPSLDPKEIAAIMGAEPPDPMRRAGSYVDIDISRQILIEVRDGKVVNTFPISTASGEYYVSEGEVRIAQTPRGNFTVSHKIPGWRVSDLGELYYPVYFYGGYAIHGSPSVPDYPASHGCVRIPMHVAPGFFERTAEGTDILVHD